VFARARNSKSSKNSRPQKHFFTTVALASSLHRLWSKKCITMSFLLRKPARGVPVARPPPPHRGVASKSTARPSRGGGPQQQQQLLQRRPATTTQQQRTTQSTKSKSQQVTKETQEELQGVISMEEGEFFVDNNKDPWRHFFGFSLREIA
jgi:hypothetical protein